MAGELTSFWLARGRGVVSQTSFEPEASALFSRMTVQPDNTRKTLINALIKSLKDGGVWSTLDALWGQAAADAQSSRLNWVADSYNLTAVASPTFTVDRGYQGDGASSYLANGFNPFTSPGIKYSQDSGHISVWSRTDITGPTDYDFGGANARLNIRSSNANQPRGQLNDATLSNFGATADSIGHYIINRTTSSSREVYRNGVQLGAVPVTSSTVPNTEITLLKADGSNFSRRAQAFASVGSGLNSGQCATLYNAINAYLTAIGAA